MTSVEALADLKRKMGQMCYGLGASDLYEHIDAAKRYLEDRTYMMFKGAVPLAHSVGAKTFTLTDTGVIQLTSNCTVQRFLALWYKYYKEMDKENVRSIKAKRAYSDSTGIPYVYALHSPAGALTLEIYYAIQEVGTFEAPVFYCDIIEKTPPISVNQDPLWPDYADDAILWRATVNVCKAFRDRERITEFKISAAEEHEKVRVTANERSSGRVRAMPAQ